MARSLTSAQIEAACRDLLQRQRRVGVRDVMHHLREQHDLGGKTRRVGNILRRVTLELNTPRPASAPSGIPDLLERLRAAEARAARAEELERSHQDFWARRYDQKLQELERQLTARQSPPSPGVSAERYLRACQRAAELARRLAEYEAVEPFIP